MSNNKLSGKVALVTGASRSLGAAIAKRLAADGASVAITYSTSPAKADDVVRAIEAAGGKALAIKADAADADAVRAAVTKTVATFDGIDILVNNAGVLAVAPIEKFSLEDFDKRITVNVRGLFVATQEAARQMRDGGRIIHIGSCNSDRMPFAVGRSMRLVSRRERRWRGIVVDVTRKRMKPCQGRHIRKMSLLTELEILGDGFLQRRRTYGAGILVKVSG